MFQWCDLINRILTVPASAQQIRRVVGSTVRAFGSPMPSRTSTLLFCPSTVELSIFGASRFQSVQYRVLQGVNRSVHPSIHFSHRLSYTRSQWMRLCSHPLIFFLTHRPLRTGTVFPFISSKHRYVITKYSVVLCLWNSF